MSRTDKDTPAWVRARRLPANYDGDYHTSEGHLGIWHDGCAHERPTYLSERVSHRTVYVDRPADWHVEEYEVLTRGSAWEKEKRTRVVFGPYRVPVDTVVERTTSYAVTHECDLGSGRERGTDCVAFDLGTDRSSKKVTPKSRGRNAYHTTRRAAERRAVRDARFGDFEAADRLAPNGRDLTHSKMGYWWD